MIKIIVTGGTLDKDYDPLTGELFFPETHLPSILAQANISVQTDIQVVCQKDSLEMIDADRLAILNACQDAQEKHIVITHGTDTMPETAQFLFNHSSDLNNKTIILTGAMRPYQLGASDALFNLGSAIMAVKITRPGVYIAMNGQLFMGNQVRKNLSLGQFESTQPKFG